MKYFLVFFYLSPFLIISQNTSIGFFFGSSIGYNATYGGDYNPHSLLDINFNSGDGFFSTLSMLDDNDMSYNIEAINGFSFGVKANLPVTNGLSIQPEIEFQQLDFYHILHQYGNNVVFSNLTSALSGFEQNGVYKIANYAWKVNYLNFPFLLKIYPSNKLFFQFGFKFGFLIKAEETRIRASFNVQNQEYTAYNTNETVLYEFFDSNSGIGNHGFDINEWPFNIQAAILGGCGFETNSFYLSLRYNLGLIPFFKEYPDKEDDFFENYNMEVDENTYQSFESSSDIINNNFKLHSITLTFGWHISN